MKAVIRHSIFICFFSMVSFQSKAQNIRTGSQVFFQMNREEFLRIDGAIPRGIYHFQQKLYVIGTLISQNKNYGTAEVRVKYFLYTCFDTSETWIKTRKINIERHSYEDKLLRTETRDLNIESKYKTKIYLLRPFSETVNEALTRGNIVNTTSGCPTLISKNSMRTRTK